MSHKNESEFATAIAVIGVGCRFPQANDAEAFWANIAAGRTSFAPIPKDRWDHTAIFHPSQRETDKAWTAKGSFIDSYREFAAMHYGIAPRRLEVMDPQQRLLIEASRVAIQTAGYETKAFERGRTGVFMGVSVSEFKNLAMTRVMGMQLANGDFGPAAGSQALRAAILETSSHVVPIRAFSLAGSITALNAAAISQTFDLGGPSYTIDAACASATVGINDAVLQLRAGVIDCALAGGAYVNLTPENLVCFTRIGAISPSGACRPFDERADGFVQSDGVGVVFLKRYEDALRDNDPIIALIRGTACLNDGRGEGPMTPRVEGQLATLRAAYRDAGFGPDTVDFFEAHGTGTAVGDPVEIEALGTFLAEAGKKASAPARIGSVKGNIGHAMAAAGIAGFVKALKILEHRLAPPQPEFTKPHKNLSIDRFPLAISTALEPLAANRPLRAAISSFGFGGTNSHIILESAPSRSRTVHSVRASVHDAVAISVSHSSLATHVAPDSDGGAMMPDSPEAFVVSAPTVELLAGYLGELARALGRSPFSLGEFAYTLNARRKRERFRLVFGARSKAEACQHMDRAREELSSGATHAVIDAGAPDAQRTPRVAFMFPGQGAQRLHLMGSLRKRFSSFSKTFAAFESRANLPRRLSDYVYPTEGDVREHTQALTATEVCQPAMAALGLTVASMLEAVGVSAEITLGHSLGEFAALAHAGAIEPKEAVRLVALRGQFMRDLGLDDAGTMAAVTAGADVVRGMLQEPALASSVWLANINQPRQVSISGTKQGVAQATELLRARGLEVRPLDVSHAFHTPLLAPMREAMQRALAVAPFAAPTKKVVSATKDSVYGADLAETRATLLDHATASVDFVRALERAASEGANIFVNVGAGSMLSGFARASLAGRGCTFVNLVASDDDDGLEFLRGLATLSAHGVAIDFDHVYADEFAAGMFVSDAHGSLADAGEGMCATRGAVVLPESPLVRDEYWIVRKDRQPVPRLEHPLPNDGDRFGVIHLEAKEPEMAQQNGDLVKLFLEQAELLRRHAEIIAEQNRLLSRAAATGAVATTRAAHPAAAGLTATQGLSASGASGLSTATPTAGTPVLAYARTEDTPSRGAAFSGVALHATNANLGDLANHGESGHTDSARNVTNVDGGLAANGATSGASNDRATSAGGLGASATSGLSKDEVTRQLFDVVARISAFPRESLRREQRLVDELGFDSLMVADLAAAIQTTYPTLGALPPTLFGLQTTTNDLADYIARTLNKAIAVVDAPKAESPLGAYSLRVVSTPRRHSKERDLSSETWLVLEDESPLSRSVAEALARRGAKTIRVQLTKLGVSAPSKLSLSSVNLWPEAFPEGLAAALATAQIKPNGLVCAFGAGPGSASDVVVRLASWLSPISADEVVVVTGLGGRLGFEDANGLAGRSDDATCAASGVLGFVKSLARERAGIVRAIDVRLESSPAENAEEIAREICSVDISPEVGLVGGDRFTVELMAAEFGQIRRTLSKDDVVLITGGMGEIAGRVADSVARKNAKALILVGRSAASEATRDRCAQLSRMGTPSFYVSADISKPGQLAAAAEPLLTRTGPVTVALHAAGIIEDAPLEKKTTDGMRRVIDTKVEGALAVLGLGAREVVFFSSWAGRFGNASQVDYAAANEVIDHLAASNGALSVVWPPWTNTKMVQSIPAGLRTMMRGEGVTFVADEEGLATFWQAFEARARGVLVVGRELPARRTKTQQMEHFSLERHPWLNDHRLKGRPVVPLAVITDWVATNARTDLSQRSVVVEDLELLRGVMGEELAAISVQRDEYRGRESCRVEVRVGKEGAAHTWPVAYRARLEITPKVAAPAATPLPGAVKQAQISLETFYSEQTFHGPAFQGVSRIDVLTDQGIVGRVRSSDPRQVVAKTGRTSWAIDPLVLDGAFQLAAYWAHQNWGRAGFPIGFDRLTLHRPQRGTDVTCTITLRAGSTDSEVFEGSIVFADDHGVFATLENVRARFADGLRNAAAVPTNGSPVNSGPLAADLTVAKGPDVSVAMKDVPEESWNIAAFPEVELLDQRFQMAELIGLRNPYFHVHAGTARDTSVIDGVEMINFSSYNYLGFSGHPEVVAAAQASIDRYGTSVSASRVASGERAIHRELEEGIAKHVGVDDSIVFVSGHATNVTTVGHLFDRQDLILHDALIHDSIMQGIHLSGATRRPFPHNDLDALERILLQVRGNYRRVLLTVEGIYSMDGDTCDLPRLIELKKRFKCLLLVDEAHSIGVLGAAGRGVAHHFAGVDPRDVDLWMGTLSKSFASCGGYIAGSHALVRYLKYTAPGFVYSAGITPPNAAAAIKSLELMQRHPELVEQLRSRSKFFLELARSRGIDTGQAIGAAVVPAIIGNSLECMKLSAALATRGVNVQPIVYPAVEDNAARLRFFISATHTEAQLTQAVDILVEELARVRQETSDSMSATF